VVSAELRQKIYQLWREDTRLLERNKFITDIYESFIEKQDIQELVKVCMANYILEGIYFYSGFATIYSYARKGVLLGVASEIRYIQRDELTHLALFQNIFRELQRENPHLFTPELVEELREMMRQAVEMEIRWGQYVTGGKIAGLSDTNIDQYIKWLSNQRLKNIGIEPLYPEVVENPVKWVDQFSSFNAQKTDFFEQKVLNYSKSANVDWDDL
jgi:ribonucleoside-diphosphate reductase beta chain